VAALAGAQTIALCSYDEAYTIPTPRSALISLRTLQLLMDEVGLRDTNDPLAGSYFIETLTKEMEHKIEEEMEKVEKVGGIVHAVATGYIQRMVARQAYEFEKGIQTGELLKVGVNIHTEGESMEVQLHEYNRASAEKQIRSVKRVRRERNNRDVKRTLSDLTAAIKAGKNVMPYLVDCCKAYATVGEMTGVFREQFGEFDEPSLF
jgi:methylmalonyl-CoA mutase N-terminal domain/subunit